MIDRPNDEPRSHRRANRLQSDSTASEHDVEQLRADASSGCPDLTRSIMGRLGYMRATRLASRKRSIRRWAGRSALLVTVILSLNIAVRFHENSDQIRRPAGLTIPEALGHDLDDQQRRVGSFIQTIRSLSPANQPSDTPAKAEPGQPLLNEDANRSVAAMMRWV